MARPLLKREPRLIAFIRRAAYRLVGIRSGPAMLQIRGEWLYIAPDGQTFRVRPTYDPDMPLTISREHY
jgi:hypothetical protein